MPLLEGAARSAVPSLGASRQIILASASLARRRLLARAGVRFAAKTVFVDEKKIRENLRSQGANAVQASLALAEAKTRAVPDCTPQALVIGADQILEHGGLWFGKPLNQEKAREQLKLLRGQKHTLVSSVCVLREKRVVWSHTGVAVLTMRHFSSGFLESYLAEISKTALDSAGAYQLEGTGSQLFSSVEGDYFTILGLPLLPLLEFLRLEGVLKA